MAKPADYRDAGFNPKWLAKNKEVKRVVDRYIKSVKSGGAWNRERLKQEIEATNWYRNKTEAQRRWSVIQQEQPREAKQMIADNRRAVTNLAENMGVTLSKADTDKLARQAARNEWDEDDFRVAISRRFKKPGEVGDARNIDAAITAMQKAYLVNVSQATRNKWITEVLRGDKATEDFEDYFRDRAATLYRGVRGDLQAGSTTMEVLEPYLEDASRELGVTQATINPFDAKWTAALNGDDGEPLTREQWMARLRTDQRYGWDATTKAQNEAAKLGNNLLSMFGVR